MKKKKYAVKVCFGEGKWFDGLTVLAFSENEAEDKSLQIVGDRLCGAFPEMDIEYSVKVCEIE